MSNGWNESAAAWIASMGTEGDWGRRYVLDAPMLDRARGHAFRDALDIGCGEGRFCRILRTLGMSAVGIDPTAALIEHAREQDPSGDYRVASAEALPFDDRTFDLAVCYLSLIDVDDLGAAIREAHRVLRAGGRLLVANLQSFNTAADPQGWTRDADGSPRFCIDHYLQERPQWIAWNGIRIRNWHRPLQVYMSALLDVGFELRHFAEPEPKGVTGDKADRYRRAPNFLVMEWEKVRDASRSQRPGTVS